jgi:hypothetical protein
MKDHIDKYDNPHFLKHACLIDKPILEECTMRLDYLHLVERADNLMELLNLIELIKVELGKFASGEYKDQQYKEQLDQAYELANKKFEGKE